MSKRNRKDQNQKLSSQHKKYRHKINGVKKINQKKKKKQMVETISLTHRSLGKKKEIKKFQTSIRKSHEKEINNKHEEGKEKIA